MIVAAIKELEASIYDQETLKNTAASARGTTPITGIEKAALEYASAHSRILRPLIIDLGKISGELGSKSGSKEPDELRGTAREFHPSLVKIRDSVKNSFKETQAIFRVSKR